MKFLTLSSSLRSRLVILIVLLLSNIISFTAISGDSNNDDSSDNILKLNYKFSAPVIETGNGFDIVTIPDLELTYVPTEPMLPFKTTNILMPPNTEIAGIEVETYGQIELEGIYNINYALEPVPIIPDPPEIETVPDPDIYGSNDPYPSGLFELVSVESFRGYEIAIMNIFPVQYLPASGIVQYYDEIELYITLTDSPQKTPTDPSSKEPIFRNSIEDETELLSKIDNPEIINNYRLWAANNGQPLNSPLAPTWEYLIITNNALNTSSGTYTLQDLATARNAQGLDTKIILVENITANPAFWDNTPLFNDTQAQIRNAIIYYYNNWGTVYVLLAGDGDGADKGGESGDNIIPSRGFYVAMGSYTDYNIPSDLYYSALGGNWNNDQDSNWGETGEEDLYTEVYVGRAAVDSDTELSNFVNKTLYYETTYDLYLDNVLMVGELLWSSPLTYGGDYKDEILYGGTYHGYTTAGIPDVYTTDTLYDKDGTWSKSELITKINTEDFHLINHLGHSNINYNMRMNNANADALNNDHPFFGYSQGCYPGAFDNRGTGANDYKNFDCIVEHFMGQPKGTFAFVGNSRYGWGAGGSTNGPSQFFDREFFDALFGEDIRELGKANHDSKEDNNGRFAQATIRWCYYQTNLFGDPSLKIHDPSPPPHEIKVEDLQAPDYAVPGILLDIKATVNNTGLSNETNLEINFTVDNVLNQSKNIPFLEHGKSTLVNFSWTPAGGIYDVRIEATPVPGEFSPLNNNESQTVIAENDLAVTSMDLDKFIITGIPIFINGTVENFAKIDAASVDVKLKVDGTPVNSTTLSNLNSGTSQPVSFGWTPTNNGSYTVSILADPLLGESQTLNNELGIDTYAWPKPAKLVVVLDSGGTDAPPPSWNTLNSNWLSYGNVPIEIDYKTFDYEDITYTHLKQVKPDVLMISCALDATTGQFTDAEVAAIEQYVKEGHGLIATDATLYYTLANNNDLAPLFGVRDDLDYDYHWNFPANMNILNTSHPLFDQISNPYVPAFKGSCIPDNDNTWDTNDLAGGTFVALGNGGGDGAVIAHRGLVLITNWPEYNSNAEDLQLLYNAMNWSKYEYYTHDIQVSNIRILNHVDGKASVGKLTTINATIYNIGDNPENNIQVKFEVDGALQSSTVIPTLAPGAYQNVSFQWVPNIAAIYDIGVQSPAVSNEVYLYNNVKNATVIAVAQPNIWNNPPLFDVTIEPNKKDNKILKVGNSGLLPLKYNVVDHPRFIEDFSSETIDGSKWPTVEGSPVINDRGSSEPSTPYSMNLDSSSDKLTSTAISLVDATDAYFHFYYERGGNGDAPELINELYLEYYTNLLDWTLLWSIAGNDLADDSFVYVKLKLPPGALHNNFRFRFSTVLDEPGKDDFFIDNIYVNCTTDEDWLSVATKSGTIVPSTDIDISLTLDSNNLNIGDYKDQLLINSNDPLESPRIIPVELKVRKDLDHIHMSTDHWEGTADGLPKFTAIGHDENHNLVIFQQYWSTTDPLGTVENGIYNPGMEGTWKVYCNDSDGSVSNFTTVKVNPGILHHIKVTPKDHTMTADEAVQYSAVACDSDNNEFGISAPTWSVTGGGVINATGGFRADTAGTWTVQARYNDKTGHTNVNIEIGKLTQVKVIPEAITLSVGESIQFNASGLDAKGNSEPIAPVWNVSGGGEIDKDSGVFTAKIAGVFNAYATYSMLVGSATITVLAGELHHITVNPLNCTISVGMKKQFNAIGYDQNYNPVKLEPDWTVTGGGTITQTGLFTGKEIGTWNVFANHSGKTGSATVNVIIGILDHIMIDPAVINMYAGETMQIKALGCDIDENIVDDDLDVDWELQSTESGDPIGTITTNGLFKAMKVGTWKITATYTDKTANAAAIIEPGLLDRLQLTPSNITMEIGTTQTFSAKGYDLYDNKIDLAPSWEATGGGTLTALNDICEFTAVAPGIWILFANHSTKSDSAEIYIIPVQDQDGDGIPDEWELDNGLDPTNPNDATEDSDLDYLDNFNEYLRGTDPNDPDSDADELPDGWEVANGLDPLDDSGNYGKYGDLDGDGSTNLQEYQARTDPNDSASFPTALKSEPETDGFGYYLLLIIIIIIATIILLAVLVGKRRKTPEYTSEVEPLKYQEDINCPKCDKRIKIPISSDPTLHLECRECGARGYIPNPNIYDERVEDEYLDHEPEMDTKKTQIDWDDEAEDYFEVDEYEGEDEEDGEIGDIDWDE